MSQQIQEFTVDDYDFDSNPDVFNLGRYDEEEDLFLKIQNRKSRQKKQDTMLRFRCCSAVAALFFQPSGAVRSVCWVMSRNVVIILVYFALSIGLTFYQNHLLKEIHFPLSVVLCHLVVKFLLSSVLRLIYEVCTGKRRVLLDCSNWLKRLSLVGISGGLDIGFSNWGQEFITVSLYTMSKSTAIIFILGFALFLKLEEKHWSLIIIVGMISGGLIMFTYKSTQFNLLGFSLIMMASFLSGLRWSMCQLIVQRSTLGLQNPIDMVYHVQPWMIIAVLPFALFFEGSLLSQKHVSFQTMQEKAEFLNAANSILIGALMAFFMEVAEYLVISYTSSLTLSVAGIFKEICTLCLAVIFNNDELSFINFIGLVMCFTGIILHVGFKFARSTTEINNSSGAGGGCASIVTPVNSSGSNGTTAIITSGPGGSGKLSQDVDLITPLLADTDSTTTASTSRNNLDHSSFAGESDEEHSLWTR